MRSWRSVSTIFRHHRATAGWSRRFVPLPVVAFDVMPTTSPSATTFDRTNVSSARSQLAVESVPAHAGGLTINAILSHPRRRRRRGGVAFTGAMGRRRLQVRVLVGCSGQKRARHCPRDRAESFQRAPRSRRLHHPLPTSGLAADYRDGHRTNRGVHDVIEPAHGGGVHVLLPAEWSTSAPARGAGV